MKKIVVGLLLLNLIGCTDSVQQYHIGNAIKVCGSVEQIHHIYLSSPAKVAVCTDGRQFSILSGGVKDVHYTSPEENNN
jgi:hypothetical protein